MMKLRLVGLLILAMVLLSACIRGPIIPIEYGDAAATIVYDNRLDEAVRIAYHVEYTDGRTVDLEGSEVHPHSVLQVPFLISTIKKARLQAMIVSSKKVVLDKVFSRHELDEPGQITIVIGP